MKKYGSKPKKNFGNNVETSFKSMKREFDLFTDTVISQASDKLISPKRGKGNWQNSGYLSKYTWNRYHYKDEKDNNLVIFFSLNSENLFISIGLHA